MPRVLVAELILLGARLAEHDRIDDLQMRRVGGKRQMHIVAVEIAVGGGAEMIFHVAGAFDIVRVGRAALEFVEDGAVGLAQHVDEHVQPPAMRHAENDLAHAELAAALDDLLQRRDHRFGAIQAEALGAGIFLIEELFEGFGLDQLGENGLLAKLGEADILVDALDALLNPGFLLRHR